jgi:sugar lactone lactonase YvrE
MSPFVRIVLKPHAVNGEGPQWDDLRQRLFWVDMRRPSLNAFDPESGDNTWWEMPGWIGCFGLMTDGRLAVALRTGLHLFDPEHGSLRFLAAPPYDPRRVCFNDGGCDRSGHFLAGPLHHGLGPSRPGSDDFAEAPFWRYDGESGWSGLTAGVKTSNGLAFSPDGRTLYYSDTSKKTIWACDYDASSGRTENTRVFAQVDEGGAQGGPDGAVVDRDGYYTCAVFGSGCLLRFDPAGALERRIELPVRCPTKPALGGEGRATLYVTSASFPFQGVQHDEHPDAGALLALEAPAPGLPTSYMTSPQEPPA